MNTQIPERQFIAEIKEKVRSAQYEALKTVNVKLIQLCWEIGKSISEKQSENWGKSIVTSLSKELQAEFPKTSGFSTTNIWYMVGEISRSKHLVILSKCKLSQERQFYILSTSKYSWSKNTLLHQIEKKAFERYLLNQTNFDYALPKPISKDALLAIVEYSLKNTALPLVWRLIIQLTTYRRNTSNCSPAKKRSPPNSRIF